MAKSGDLQDRGLDFVDIKLNLDNLMKAKTKAVDGLTAGVSMLFKKNKASLTCENLVAR